MVAVVFVVGCFSQPSYPASRLKTMVLVCCLCCMLYVVCCIGIIAALIWNVLTLENKIEFEKHTQYD